MELTPINPVNAHQSMCGQCEDKNAVVVRVIFLTRSFEVVPGMQ